MIQAEQSRLDSLYVHKEEISDEDKKILGLEYKKETNAADLLKRPNFSHEIVTSLSVVGPPSWGQEKPNIEQIEQVQLQIETQAKYAGYIQRQEREIQKQAKHEALILPKDIDYAAIQGLSNEAQQRLQDVLPESLGQASRLEGITPATISLLLLHIKKRYTKKIA